MGFEIVSENVEFALCPSNEGYPESLETGKLYRVVPDKDVAVEGYLRIIDESGEDYAFAAFALPTKVETETPSPR